MVDVASIARAACVIQTTGRVQCWGANDYGQVGNGSEEDALNPTAVQGLDGVVGLDSGCVHRCAVRAGGSLWCWGSNLMGKLGDGTTVDRNLPQRVPGLSGVVSVALGCGHSCALIDDGTVWCWGLNVYGQVGNGVVTSHELVPEQVVGLDDVRAIFGGGSNHSCAIRNDDSAWCWGDDLYGELGDGQLGTYTAVPRRVLLPDDPDEVFPQPDSQ